MVVETYFSINNYGPRVKEDNDMKQNGSDKETTANLSIYAEILQGHATAKDVLTGKTIQFGKELKMQPRETLLLEL